VKNGVAVDAGPAADAAAGTPDTAQRHATHDGYQQRPSTSPCSSWAMGIPVLIERLYASTTTLAAGGWVAVATALGRRRRAPVRSERKLEAWPDIAPGHRAGRISGHVRHGGSLGMRPRLRLARGQTIADLTAKIPAIESGLGTSRGAVRVYPAPDDLANRSLAAGQRGEHVGEDGVGPGVQLVVGQELDRMGDVDHAGGRHAEPTCLLDGFVGERCRRDADRRDAPALQVNQVMQTARRA
jgi:hypothetical protein